MIIRGQDRKVIVNMRNVDEIEVGNPLEDNYGMYPITAHLISDCYVELGLYTTEERAKDIIEEIYATNSKFEYFKCARDTIKHFLEDDMQENLMDFDGYEMPNE